MADQLALGADTAFAAPRLDRRTEARPDFTAEQLEAIDARRPLVALSAGAGSGKTTVLVARFLALVLDDDVSPLDILAITYTERAAAEMKERIVRRFEERGDEVNRRRAEAAYISTIHGFCARLLREHPLEAGVDPAFGIASDLERGIFLDERLEALLGENWFVEALPRFPTRFGAVRPALFELVHDAAFGPADFGFGEPAEATYDEAQHVEAARRRVAGWMSRGIRAAADALVAEYALLTGLSISGAASTAKHGRLVELVDAVRAGAIPDATWASEICAVTSFTSGGRKEPRIDEVRALFERTRPTLKAMSVIDPDREAELERALVAPLKVQIHRAARDLRQHGMRSSASACCSTSRTCSAAPSRSCATGHAGALRAPLRPRAARRGAGHQRRPEALVDAVRPAGQPLFAVGDVKQAIYGFRGANVDIFRDLHRSAGDGRLSLRDNYRSRTPVIEAVNAIGERMWANDVSLDYEPLTPKLPYPSRPRPCRHVQLHLVQPDDAEAEASEDDERGAAARLREREAVWIAARLRAAVEGEAGSPPLSVGMQARLGSAPSDTATSPFSAPRAHRSPSMSGHSPMPASVRQGRRPSGFFDGREVQDVLAALGVVHNPLDDVALLAALRSPLFGWSDTDLVLLRTAAGRRPLWTPIGRGFTPSSAAAALDVHTVFADLRRRAVLGTPAEVIGRLLDTTAYEAALLCHPRGRAQVANLRKLIAFARDVAEFGAVDRRVPASCAARAAVPGIGARRRGRGRRRGCGGSLHHPRRQGARVAAGGALRA